jgi:hypothetical protein
MKRKGDDRYEITNRFIFHGKLWLVRMYSGDRFAVYPEESAADENPVGVSGFLKSARDQSWYVAWLDSAPVELGTEHPDFCEALNRAVKFA